MCTFGVAVGDIDQAYEQCSRERAWQGWHALPREFGDHVSVVDRLDRKHVIIGEDYSRRGWSMHDPAGPCRLSLS